MVKITIINGPNLNRLGTRQPQIYGTRSMEQVMVDIQQRWPDVYFTYRQSNHEGDIIDYIQAAENEDGIVLNAGGYTHTSVAIRDAVVNCACPVVEVHISDIKQREPFRRISLLTDVCVKTIIGKGTDGYQEAIDYIIGSNH